MDQANDPDLQLGKWLAGAALGAIVMYMLDPERGAPRRAQSGQKLRELGRQTGDVLDKVVHGIGSRIGEAGSAVRAAASDAGSTARDIASEAGSAVRDMASQVRHGAATARSDEAPTSASHPGGQAGALPDGAARSVMQPAQELVQQAGNLGARIAFGSSAGMGAVALAGGALGLYGLFARRSPLALALGLAGMALLARGVGTTGTGSHGSAGRKRSLRGMLSSARPARPVIVEKTIRIDAPPEQVYDMFANYENFPRFMSNVVEVRDLGKRRSHWVVRGPAGSHFQWNAILTESTRPRRLAWESEPGAEVEQTGAILFEPFRNGTRVTVHMSYKPPAGVVGHALASLLGSDPKRQMDEDLSRMKSLVERGAASRLSAQSGNSSSTFLH